MFDECGVRFAHEVHPSEIAYDYWSTVRTLEAIGHREAFGLNWDPSHMLWQDLDPVAFISDFADRIYHVDCKDTRLRLGGGRNGRLSSHLPWGDPRRGWDFVSTGRGEVPWEDSFRALAAIGYDGPGLGRVGGRRHGPPARRPRGAGVPAPVRLRAADRVVRRRLQRQRLTPRGRTSDGVRRQLAREVLVRAARDQGAVGGVLEVVDLAGLVQPVDEVAALVGQQRA